MGIHDLFEANETFALIQNVDGSILKLNPIIEPLGYRFRVVDPEEFEMSFSEIVNLPRRAEIKGSMKIGKDNIGISYEFFSALVNNPMFGERFIYREYPEIVLLERFLPFSFPVFGAKIKKGNIEKHIETLAELSVFSDFVADFILQLRLHKTGEIRCPLQFKIGTVLRNITYRNSGFSIGTTNLYTIDDNDVNILKERLKLKYEASPLIELAVKNFDLTYNIPDVRIRYITLMTCLESLFNQGKDQIAHTISRHLALILSKDKTEFKENYSRVKKLYGHRSTIVHGSTYKGQIDEDYLDLENKVRAAIKYCEELSMTREQLFEALNTLGFPE